MDNVQMDVHDPEDNLVEDLAKKVARNLKVFSDDDFLRKEMKDRLLKSGLAKVNMALQLGISKIHKKCYDRFNCSKLYQSVSAKK